MENARNSHEYFQLLCRLLNYAFMSNCPLPTAETLLNNEIAWLKKIRVSGLCELFGKDLMLRHRSAGMDLTVLSF